MLAMWVFIIDACTSMSICVQVAESGFMECFVLVLLNMKTINVLIAE